LKNFVSKILKQQKSKKDVRSVVRLFRLAIKILRNMSRNIIRHVNKKNRSSVK